jgi:glycosyltransferase involved in cell wall biosynthesis
VIKSLALRRRKPQVSFVVCVYNMVDQAMNTLFSLSTDYQRGVDAGDYEVIVVENESPNTLEPQELSRLKGNFRYFLRQETQPTPVFAMNEGVSNAESKNVCVMIDGARMVTPGIVEHLLKAHRLSANTIVSVPGYHLGDKLQQQAVGSGYTRETEKALLERIGWPKDGYALFDIACFSASCSAGFFLPHSESNCLSVPLHLWHRLEGFDTRFNAVGGGLANLDLYKRACELPESDLVSLPGEGTFHQFHAGVTTGGVEQEERRKLLEEYFAQYREIRGKDFKPPKKQAALFGLVPPNCQKFIRYSSSKVLDRNQANL